MFKVQSSFSALDLTTGGTLEKIPVPGIGDQASYVAAGEGLDRLIFRKGRKIVHVQLEILAAVGEGVAHQAETTALAQTALANV